MAHQGTITCLSDLLRIVDQSPISKCWAPHIQHWFRGHGDASWSLEPGAYRSGLPPEEAEQIKSERHLTQDFMSFSSNIRRNIENNAELYFLQQHYSMPTRLLDWSGNPLAALFFALDPNDKDGVFFMLDSFGFEGGHKTVRHPDFLKALDAIFSWNDDAWPEHIMAVRPPNMDHRVIAQKGFFTFHPKGKRVVGIEDNDTIASFLIPKDSKILIRKELEVLNVNDFTIYGDLDHLASWLKRVYRKVHQR